MNYGAIIVRAWDVTRRSRTLKRLAAISAAQLIVYSVVLAALLVPLTVLPQLTMSLSGSEQGALPGADVLGAAGSSALTGGAHALMRYVPAMIAGMAFLFAVWIVLGVLDIAAQAGMIAEADGELHSLPAGVRERMRGGFRVWWRVAALSAVAAMPTLLMLLALGLSTTFTYTIPLWRGQLPDPAAALGGQLLMVPLQGVAAVATTVLAVLVQIALRSAVLEDLHWRESLGRGFDLIKANLAHVVLTYLILAAISAALLIGVSIGASVLIGAVSALAISLLVASSTAYGTAVFGLMGTAALVLTVAGVVLYALFIAWTSAVWTILWRNLTTPPGQAATSVRPPSVHEPSDEDFGPQPVQVTPLAGTH